jgi:enoyl-CoA hydratase/carnithine racemase
MSDQSTPYRDYSHIAMERSEGVLEMRLHTDGGPLVFSQSAHLELTDAFAALAGDYENRAVIITGTGEAFCERLDYSSFDNPTATPLAWSRIEREDAGRIRSILDIPCPVIAAINGPARVHAEIAVLSDIVLANDTAVLQDGAHFLKGIVPGDGVHVIWPLLLGINRGRYFLLTGQELSAQEALELGVVNEVLPAERLLDRARELARRIAARPPLTIQNTRRCLTRELKRLMQESLEYGLALEGHGSIELGNWRMDPEQ